MPHLQQGTPDLDLNDSETLAGDPFARLARRLHVNERAPVHWDDADLDRMLVMRPLENETCMRCAPGIAHVPRGALAICAARQNFATRGSLFPVCAWL